MISEWKTIDSAPKDGSPVLLARPASKGYQRHIGTWNVNAASWIVGELETGFRFRPQLQSSFTHWTELPKPPKGE